MLVAELAFDVLDLEMGRVDVPLEMVGLHEAGAALGAKVWSAKVLYKIDISNRKCNF